MGGGEGDPTFWTDKLNDDPTMQPVLSKNFWTPLPSDCVTIQFSFSRKSSIFCTLSRKIRFSQNYNRMDTPTQNIKLNILIGYLLVTLLSYVHYR